MGRPEDKRDTERIEILGELKGEVTVFQPMAIREISRGGALIETGFPLQLDSLHEFRLTLGDRSVVVKGRVAHCSITDVEHELDAGRPQGRDGALGLGEREPTAATADADEHRSIVSARAARSRHRAAALG